MTRRFVFPGSRQVDKSRTDNKYPPRFHCCILEAGRIGFNGVVRGLFLYAQLLEKTVGVSPLVHQIEHIADVYTDAARKYAVEVDVT